MEALLLDESPMEEEIMPETCGSIAKSHLETKFVWKIANFFAFAENKSRKLLYNPKFQFAGLPWYFILSKEGDNESTPMEVILMSEEREAVAVEYNFALEDRDGKAEKSLKGVQNVSNAEECSFPLCFTLLEIYCLKYKLASSGVVTIACTMKRVPTQPDEAEEPKRKKLKRFDTLSENFKHLFGIKESCDTTLYVRDREFKAHRAVLIARSSVFAAMFLHETSEKQTGIVNIPNCDPNSFGKFLKYLYCGTLKGVSPHSALCLYETSNKYDVQELKAFCKEYLLENLTKDNLCDVVILADRYEDIELLSEAQDIFNEKLNEILETLEWDSLVQNNYRLAKRLLKEMSSKVKFVR